MAVVRSDQTHTTVDPALVAVVDCAWVVDSDVPPREYSGPTTSNPLVPDHHPATAVTYRALPKVTVTEDPSPD